MPALIAPSPITAITSFLSLDNFFATAIPRVEDIEEILNNAKKLNCKIITSEKDYSRFENNYKNEIKIVKSELKITDEEKLLTFLL